MSAWVGILARWRASMERDAAFEGRQPPADEEVLSQLVYSAITDFIERDEFRLIDDLDDEGFDLDAAICAWADDQDV